MHLALWFTSPSGLKKIQVKSTERCIPDITGCLAPRTKELVKSRTIEAHVAQTLGCALRGPLSRMLHLLMEVQLMPRSTEQGRRGGHPAGGDLLIAVTVKRSRRSYFWQRAQGQECGKRKTVWGESILKFYIIYLFFSFRKAQTKQSATVQKYLVLQKKSFLNGVKSFHKRTTFTSPIPWKLFY